MIQQAICTVNGITLPTSGETGLDVLSGSTITVALAVPGSQWNINCTEADGYFTDNTVAYLQNTKIQDFVHFTCQFTLPNTDFIALQFTSIINNDPTTAFTFGIFVRDTLERRYFFIGENLESNLTYGIAYDLNRNQAITLGTGGTPTGTAGGDLGGLYPNPTVIGIDGNAITPLSDGYLYFSGSNMQWINLSSLPPSGVAGGDLSGTYPNPLVAAISGASPINITPSNLRFLATTSTPTISQATASSDIACQDLQLSSQAPFASASSHQLGGNIDLALPANVGGYTTNWPYARVTYGGSTVASIGYYPTTNTYSGLWFGSTAPSVSNYSFIASSAATILNGSSSVAIRVGNDASPTAIQITNNGTQFYGSSMDLGGGTGVIGLTNAGAVPTALAGAGTVLYSSSGKLGIDATGIIIPSYAGAFTIVQSAAPTSTSIPNTLTIQSQAPNAGASGIYSVPGSIQLSLPQIGSGTTTYPFAEVAYDGYILAQTGPLTSNPTGAGAIYLGPNINANSNNYTLAGNGSTSTELNVASGGSIYFNVANSNQMVLSSSLLTITPAVTLSDYSGTGDSPLYATSTGALGRVASSATSGLPLVNQGNSGTAPIYSASTAITGVGTLTSGTISTGVTIQASNVNWTGAVPAANQATQTMSGDVTGVTAASVVSKISGSSPIAIAAQNLQFVAATTNPTISQLAPISDVACQNTIISSQPPYASASTHQVGGNIVLNLPVNVGGATLSYPDVVVQYNGSQIAWIGELPSGGGTPALGFGSTAPALGTYAIGGNGTDTFVNASTEVDLRIANVNYLQATSSLITITPNTTIAGSVKCNTSNAAWALESLSGTASTSAIYGNVLVGAETTTNYTILQNSSEVILNDGYTGTLIVAQYGVPQMRLNGGGNTQLLIGSCLMGFASASNPSTSLTYASTSASMTNNTTTTLTAAQLAYPTIILGSVTLSSGTTVLSFSNIAGFPTNARATYWVDCTAVTTSSGSLNFVCGSATASAVNTLLSSSKKLLTVSCSANAISVG